MSYTVLARKWRPQNFSQLIGQEHVQRAIVNAIEQNRLHHAYLFTGTRGVGKTTIARIFSKCLNCEQGITANPCGQCAVCQEIEQGHFVDLLEIDAASRTKVEDTREILDNVQYRPSRGRYKVYLIDEVHMLSNSSFNALLKTLEEPPPHVIFLLATTDPQKLPITVLSRCLQFHLKRMAPEQIVSHLAEILTKEAIEFDQDSLKLIAKAADGSMRDSLSLLDQAIAFGAGKLRYQDVAEMLGAVDQQFVFEYLMALGQSNAQAIVDITNRMAEFAPDYQAVLAEIISSLHQIAVAQLVGREALKDSRLEPLLDSLSPEDVQLFYQLALHARKDLPLAPDAREGFEMALFRIIAFRPVSGSSQKNGGSAQKPQLDSDREKALKRPSAIPAEQKKNDVADKDRVAATHGSNENKTGSQASQKVNRQISNDSAGQSAETVKQADFGAGFRQNRADSSMDELNSGRLSEQTRFDKSNTGSQAKLPETNAAADNTEVGLKTQSVVVDVNTTNEAPVATDFTDKNVESSASSSSKTVNIGDLSELLDVEVWHDFIQQLPLTGTVYQVVNNSRLKSVNNNEIQLELLPSVEHFCTENAVDKIVEAMSETLGRKIQLVMVTGDEGLLTPRLIAERRQQQKLDLLLDEFRKNPRVNDLLTVFSGHLSKDDIQVGKKDLH